MQSFFRFNFFQQHRFESPYRSKGRLKQDFRRPFCTDKSGKRYVSEGRKKAKSGVGED